MNYSALTPRLIQIGSEILEWVYTYLTQENEHIKRPKGSQAVCPFAKAAADNDSIFLAFHPEVNGQSEENIEDIMLSYIDIFKKMGPFAAGDKFKKTLLVVFNNLPDKESMVLDVVHKHIKDKYVENGTSGGEGMRVKSSVFTG